MVDKFIQLVAEPEIKACGANPPFSIFCDSLEVTGENWTEDFLAEFKKHRGYDLEPLLPALIGNIGPQTADIRHDYGQTVTDLFNENFNGKFTALAKKYNTRFPHPGLWQPARRRSLVRVFRSARGRRRRQHQLAELPRHARMPPRPRT